MGAKLTLTIDKSVIEKAKVYAKHSGRSLSDLIQSYLERLITQSNPDEEAVPEAFKDLFGSVNLSANLEDKKVIRSILKDKHNP